MRATPSFARPIVRGAVARVVAVTLLVGGCSMVGPGRPRDPQSQPSPAVVVSLTFNDGHADQYEHARPVLASHHMPATFYVVSRWTDERSPCCMAWWQLDELYRTGHEIGGMGLDHSDLTGRAPAPWPRDRARKSREVCDDRTRLAERGYEPRSFAYPGGAFATAFPDASTPQDIVRGCGYLSARAVGGLGPVTARYANQLPPADPYALRTPDVRRSGPVRLGELTAAVTAAARRGGGWVPVAFDRVCHLGGRDYAACMASPRAVTDTVLGAFLDWLAAAGRPGGAPVGTVVRTVRAALGAPEQRPLPPRPTVVSLTFDDGSNSQYLVRSALLDRGMQATFFINTSVVDRADGSALSWSQLGELASDGNDIGGHTLTHRNLLTLSGSERRREVCDDRRRLVAHGLAAVSFAYPYGQSDLETRRLVRSCGYRSARTGGSVSPAGPVAAAVLPPLDRYATQALDGENDGPVRLSYLESAVRTGSARGGGWIQIIFHRVCRASERDFPVCMRSHRPVDIAVLTAFLDWLGTGAPAGTKVKTVRDALDAG